MGTMRYVILAGLLVGCGSGDEPAEFDCDRVDIGGLYFVDWTELDGNCATPADGLLGLSVGNPGDDCEVLSLAQDDCRFIEVSQCGESKLTLVLDQLDGNGDRVRGTLTVSSEACRGTFRLVGTRQ